MVGDVVDLNGFVAEMGYEDIQVIIFQDNRSTMHVMSEGGPPTNFKVKTNQNLNFLGERDITRA